MSEKRRRRAGRKPLDPRGSVIAPVRFTRADWADIKRLAKKHRRDASKEIRAAVHYWARLLEKPSQHVGALICLIAILVRRMEARTGQKWIDDPMTGAAVREGVERLIFHFAPTPTKPLVVPPEIAGMTGELITIAEGFYPWPGVPEVPAAVFGDEWAMFASIIKDLGSGWGRNRAVWQKEKS
jgi:hypothetical protein